MEKGRIMKFDPWLLGAIQKVMGVLPSMPADLAKVKSLTFFDGVRLPAEPGTLLGGWMEVAPGEFSAIGKMSNLHTLLFKNHRVLNVGDFGFLSGCSKLKKLDLSGTDFSDCRLLSGLPLLQYAMLPDRQLLVHTEVLEEIKACAESEQEMNERARAEACISLEDQRRKKFGRGAFIKRESMPGKEDCGALHEEAAVVRAADARLIRWIAVSLGKLPDKPEELNRIRILDSRKRNVSLEAAICKKVSVNGDMPKNHFFGKLPSWLKEKEEDFSLIGELPNLQALLLWGVYLEDFSFLSNCRELLYLNLWDTNFSDCKLLAQLPFLSVVCLPQQEQLVNYTVLEARKEARKREGKERLEGFWYGGEGEDITEMEALLSGLGPLFIVHRPVYAGCAAAACREQSAPIGFVGEKLLDSDTESAAGTMDSSQLEDVGVFGKAGKKEMEVSEIDDSEDEFADLVTVKGEDVVISCEGSSRIRHVIGEFCMDSTPQLWKAFSKMEEEEDNWSRLDPKRAQQLTQELLEAIVEGDVATLYLSMEPWGEGHMFIVEFAGGWAEITYMDDSMSVYYNSYNPAYTDPAELSPIEYDGQIPVPKMLALDDLALTAEIVRHILKTGQLLPGTLWKAGGV